MNPNNIDLGLVAARWAHDAVVALRLAQERVAALDHRLAALRRAADTAAGLSPSAAVGVA